MGQGQLTKELARTQPAQGLAGAIGFVLEHLDLAGEDQIEARRGLPLFDDVHSRGEPPDVDMVIGVAKGVGLLSKEREGSGEVGPPFEAHGQLRQPLGQPVDQQEPTAGKMGVVEPAGRPKREGFGRSLTDCYVVRVAVGTIGTKSNNYIRPNIVEDCGHLVGKGLLIEVAQGPVNVVENDHVLDTKAGTGVMQLLLANLPKGRTGSERRIANLTRLSPRG